MVDDLALAAELTRDAGKLAERMRRRGVDVIRKSSVSDVVTPADEAAEQLIVKGLRRERPSDGILGEEGTSQSGSRTWYIDPVDGTYNYAHDVPIWCTALGLAEGGDTLLGAVYHPASDELWLGGLAHPTTCNGTRTSRLAAQPLGELSLATYLHPTTLPDDEVRRPMARAVRAAATIRTFGSGSVELAWVAAGRLGAFLQHDCLPWDWVPGAALVTAAGGATRLIDLDGHRWHIAGNRQVVEEVTLALFSS
jgi:fructose-1,6-bisphosphatase/inositol monophosphatase family enzyme